LSPAETVIEAPRLRTEVRSFIARELAAGSFEPTVDSWMRSLDRSFSERLGENGWLGVTWPAEYGGGEAPNVARLAITEELLRAGAPVAAHWIAERQIGPAVLRYGTDELKREFLPRIAAGGLTFCLGMSETESGSDLAAVRTTARRDGEDFVVEGTKIWTTNAHEAQYAYVLACTDNEAEKDARLTELIVAMDDPQVEVRSADWSTLLDEGPFSLLFLDSGEPTEVSVDSIADLMEPGGLVVLDDFAPCEMWPPVTYGRVDTLREQWLTDDRFTAVEVMVAPDASVVIATKR